MSPMTERGEWISRDPAELSTHQLLADLLGYDDGYAGRGLRADGAEEAIVGRWITTPRGRELAVRLTHGQVTLALDPDPLMPSAEYVSGYDAGFGDAERLAGSRAILQATAFGLGVVVGMAIAIVLFLSAATS